MAGAEIDRLILLLAKLPGLGPRSARRAALQLIRRKRRKHNYAVVGNLNRPDHVRIVL